MLSRSQALDHAQALGVQDADELLNAASAAWRLEARREPEMAAVVIGGEPAYLSPQDWPVNERGNRLSLIARIDAGRLAALESDWLTIPVWEHHGARMDLFADRMSAGLEVIVLPRPSEDDLTAELRGGVRCAAVPHISLPSLTEDAFDDDFDAAEDYTVLRHVLAHDGTRPNPPVGISTVLGEPQSLHDDGVLARIAYQHGPEGPNPTPGLEDPGQWRVLLHLASDPGTGFDYGGGALTIASPREDLAAGKHQRWAASWQY